MIAVDAPGAATGDFLDRNARNAPSRVERRRTSTTEGSFHTVCKNFENGPSPFSKNFSPHGEARLVIKRRAYPPLQYCLK
jgi:hypothetical protein